MSKSRSKATVKVLGLYRVPCTDKLFKEAFEFKFGYPMSKTEKAEAKTFLREELSNIVLIELLIEGAATPPDMGLFCQQDGDQVPYDEHYFTLDGKKVIADNFDAPPPAEAYRVGFFLHFFDSAKPLVTPWDVIPLPQASELPKRLAKLMPYEFVD